MNNASGLSAGFLLIGVLVLCIGAGVLLGALAGSRVIGGFAGGVVGVVAAFWVVYRTFLVPLRQQSMERDYSNLKPRVDDDD